MNIGLLGIAFVVLVALIWIKNSLYVIKEWERGVVLRLGRLVPLAKSGGVAACQDFSTTDCLSAMTSAATG